MNETQKPHSFEYFGDYRDYWWNRDFLELMSKRLQLEKVKNALDVGCGVGHWGQILSNVMPNETKFLGIDLEPESISIAKQKVSELGISSRFSYLVGDATSITFPNETFDLVTCQTLLIHVADPLSVILEMKRVLKPGGLLLAVEPNNLAGQAIASSLSKNYSVKQAADQFYFQLTCERGKEALGLGNISIGDLVPGLFQEAGLGNIKVFLSDKAVPIFPPYDSEEQKINLAQSLDWDNKEFWIWDEAETKKYFFAGGGTDEEFSLLWREAIEDSATYKNAIKEKKYHTAGGTLMYLISGRK